MDEAVLAAPPVGSRDSPLRWLHSSHRCSHCVSLKMNLFGSSGGMQPDRPDELARIEAVGGRVIDVKGSRVQGILAMSRSIGDKFLKRFVTSEPEITITRRHTKEDECLILASDGLWDVISTELACEIAHSCLEQGKKQGAETGNQSMLVAALLTRLALGRDSCDNISTIVVHFKNR